LKHPIRGDALTELEKLLWRFRMVAHEAQVLMRGINHYPDAAKALNKDIWFSLSNHALIIISKFLEVWDDSNGHAKTDKRIIPMRRALEPILDRILVWKGLKALRNSALAHAYLDKEGELAPPWQPLGDGKAPTYHAEIILLLQLVYSAVLVVLTVFEKEFTPIESLCGPSSPAKEIDPGPGIAHGSKILDAAKPILEDVQARLMKELGLTVQGPLLTAFKKATTPETA
jgi:hypothetical protein